MEMCGWVTGSELRVLFLLFLTLRATWGFLPHDQLDARSNVWRQEGVWNPRVRRSLGSEGTPDTEESCEAPTALTDILAKATFPASFDPGAELSLVWVGDGSGVVLVLTTFRIPLILVTFAQSKLYRSTDYGKNFQEITALINDSYIRTEFGMGLGPENSGRVVLVADVSGGSSGGRVYRSSDFAKTFIETDLPFHPLRPVSYNPENPDHLLLLSLSYDLWISEDFGIKWTPIHKSVCSAKWGSRNQILFTTTLGNESCSDWTGAVWSLTMKRTSDYGKTFKVLKEHVHSFGLWSRFLLASVMEEDRVKRKIHVSQDYGDTWNEAQLPSVTQEQFYSVLAANNDLVFIHVDDEGDTGCGTIYTSDDRGIVYSKSLERHLYTKTGGDTDFTNVTSLRGVFITSVLAEDNSIHSVITYDQGGEWTHITKPENTKCDSTAKDKEKCSLHIHAQYSISQRLSVPLPPLTEPNAIGIIIAHGSVGDAMSIANPNVYLSDDGGYTWNLALEGPHHYTILDSGGLIVAIEQSDMPINTIKFSTDEGQCWFSYNFTNEPIMFTGLASEPGARSLNVTVWGYEPGFMHRLWKSYTIDFALLLSKNCGGQDYMTWLAHSTDPGTLSNGCILGYKESYLRLKKASMCQNGRDYTISSQPESCNCTLGDYMCDFGYFRKEDEETCEEQTEFKGHELDLCIDGEEEELTTKGYRKIPGDKCTGGVNPARRELDKKKKCVDDPTSKMQVNTANSIPVILSVVVVVLVAVAAVILIIKKYICGGRFLVHRYSVLREHMDTHGDERLESNIGEVRRSSGYHDDSDEDLLE
ncbi:sortilin [Hyperolius riggenbachi]|uniref:sortilin n=1 Tax=Hyperolius riggenbachi TaxID=752182 RepID=UPI0035A2CC08